MRILIVTSQITYVPNNCLDSLTQIVEQNPNDIAGLVILQNLSLEIILKIIWLYIIGCHNIASTLLINTFKLRFKQREMLLTKNNLPVFKVKNMNDSETVDLVRKNNIDLIINLRTRCIYKKEILNSARLGCINIHHGMLPKYRGIFCDLYALADNRPAGISIHQMNEKIDDGKIIYTKQISYKNEKNYIKYLSKTGHEEAILVKNLIEYIKKHGDLPTGIKNHSDEYVITKTPNIDTIRNMQREGIIL